MQIPHSCGHRIFRQKPLVFSKFDTHIREIDPGNPQTATKTLQQPSYIRNSVWEGACGGGFEGGSEYEMADGWVGDGDGRMGNSGWNDGGRGGEGKW